MINKRVKVIFKVQRVQWIKTQVEANNCANNKKLTILDKMNLIHNQKAKTLLFSKWEKLITSLNIFLIMWTLKKGSCNMNCFFSNSILQEIIQTSLAILKWLPYRINNSYSTHIKISLDIKTRTFKRLYLIFIKNKWWIIFNSTKEDLDQIINLLMSCLVAIRVLGLLKLIKTKIFRKIEFYLFI